MSDVSQGPGWWLASDGKWYSPEQVPGPVAPDPAYPVPTAVPMSGPGVPPAGGYGPQAPPVTPLRERPATQPRPSLVPPTRPSGLGRILHRDPPATAHRPPLPATGIPRGIRPTATCRWNRPTGWPWPRWCARSSGCSDWDRCWPSSSGSSPVPRSSGRTTAQAATDWPWPASSSALLGLIAVGLFIVVGGRRRPPLPSNRELHHHHHRDRRTEPGPLRSVGRPLRPPRCRSEPLDSAVGVQGSPAMGGGIIATSARPPNGRRRRHRCGLTVRAGAGRSARSVDPGSIVRRAQATGQAAC